MKIYLMRHGETDWNRAGKIQGNVNVPLNDKGRAVAQATAEGMRDMAFDVIFASPLERARETAAIIAAGRGQEIVTDARLREISFGEFEGITWEQINEDPANESILHFFKAPEKYVAERGAESLEAICARAQDFIDTEVLPREGQCEQMLIVAHGSFNRAFMMCVRHGDFSGFWGGSRKPMKNCSAFIMEVSGGQIEILEEGRIYYDPTLFE